MEAGKNYLTSLTPELQHIIFDNLLASHEPDKAFETTSQLKPDKTTAASHPLDYLAATCKALRDEVNDWALHFLLQHRAITKYKPVKTTRLQQRRNFLRGRNGVLTLVAKHCVFCGNKSSRSAILMNGLRCCATCDKEQWPGKITKTEAKTQYDLNDQQLLPSALVSPTAAKMLAEHPGLPKVRYGTYITSNVATTMFLRQDVEKLAALAHGDLSAHLAKRTSDRAERRKRMEETKARKDAEAASRARERAHGQFMAEVKWTYRHKHHSITSYRREDGPSGPALESVVTPPGPVATGAKKGRKHKKSLSIDSSAANEGRVFNSSPPQGASGSVSPSAGGQTRAPEVEGGWDDVPSMFNCAEWEAFLEQHYPPTPPGTVVVKKKKSKYAVLESMCRAKKQSLDWIVGRREDVERCA